MEVLVLRIVATSRDSGNVKVQVAVSEQSHNAFVASGSPAFYTMWLPGSKVTVGALLSNVFVAGIRPPREDKNEKGEVVTYPAETTLAVALA